MVTLDAATGLRAVGALTPPQPVTHYGEARVLGGAIVSVVPS